MNKKMFRTMAILFAVVVSMFSMTAAFAGNFEQPILITSIGQSADAQMVRALSQRNNLQFTYNPTASDMGGAKTLMLVIGGSSKGMGAAGVDMAEEEVRAKALISKAKSANAKIIALHIGGSARRGDLTDRFIPLVGQANYVIVVESGDHDKAFTRAAGGVPIDFPSNIVGVGQYLKTAF